MESKNTAKMTDLFTLGQTIACWAIDCWIL